MSAHSATETLALNVAAPPPATVASVAGLLQAIDRSQALIEFDLEGKVVRANANFLALMGYTQEEIGGRHHRLFVDPDDAASPAYQAFWEHLAQGSFTPVNTSAWARAERRSGSRPPTTRCSTPRGGRSGW